MSIKKRDQHRGDNDRRNGDGYYPYWLLIPLIAVGGWFVIFVLCRNFVVF